MPRIFARFCFHLVAPKPFLSVKSYLPTLLRFVLWLIDSQRDSPHSDAQSACSLFGFFFFHIYIIEFNFVLPYFLLHFQPQSLDSSLPVLLSPQSAVQASAIYNHISHALGCVLMCCFAVIHTFLCCFNLSAYGQIRVFLEVSWAQQESCYQPSTQERKDP